MDLDIAAPKVTIPTDFSPDNIHSTKLLIDLGNLIIRSQVYPETLLRLFGLNFLNPELMPNLFAMSRMTVNLVQLMR